MAVSTKLSNKEIRRRERHRRQLILRLFWGMVAALAVVVLGYAGWQALQPRPGVNIPVMASARHIDLGEQHESYNNDPPTSGPHYVQPAQAGFYDEALPDEQLVHNLEHGYIVIWYNCTGLGDSDCQTLKTKIKTVLDNAKPIALTGTKKLIAVPRPNMDTLIVLTSWGRIDRLTSFNKAEMMEYINDFRNHSPEPAAP